MRARGHRHTQQRASVADGMERILESVRKVLAQTRNLGEKRWNRHRGMRVILPVIDSTVASRVLRQELVPYTANTLKDMIQCRPQSRIDGMRNVWILKPGDKSLGRGIVLKNSLSDILNKVNHAARECMQYVVQKYIGESRSRNTGGTVFGKIRCGVAFYF